MIRDESPTGNKKALRDTGGLTFFCYLLKQIETGHQVVFIGFPDRDAAAIN